MPAEILTKTACRLAEGPLWHPEHRKVYWTDILSGHLHRYDPETGESEKVWEGPQLGAFTIQADGGLLLFLDKGGVRIWNDGQETVVFEDLPDERETRFNDVAADPKGRVFCGTMCPPHRKGRLYRLDPDGSIRVVLEEIGCSNGIGFSPDRRTMYYTDSGARTIYAFDYDEATGELTNQRPFYVYDGETGVPDGMTVDANGHVWTTIWDGGCVIHLSPEGTEVERYRVPAKKASCPSFGGENYATLYITTAGGDDKPNEGEGAGELLKLDVGVRGVPEFRSRIGLEE